MLLCVFLRNPGVLAVPLWSMRQLGNNAIFHVVKRAVRQKRVRIDPALSNLTVEMHLGLTMPKAH